MRAAVTTIFPAFTRGLEGWTAFPYLDIKGLVTVGFGCLVDPASSALALPWQIGQDHGRPATQAEIAAGWAAVKGAPPAGLTPEDLDAWLHDHAAGYYAQLTQLRLTDTAVDELLEQRLASFEAEVLKRFGDAWTDAPASAQLGTMSMAWAEGAGGVVRSPRFDAAFLRGDWATCALESHLVDAGNPGLVPRNAANKRLFELTPTTDPDAIADWTSAP